MHLISVDVVGRELEAVMARADVAKDVVVVGSRSYYWSMGAACCSECGTGKDSVEV